VPFALSVAFDRRLVLYPQGQASRAEHRARCSELVLWCGGDIGRVIDSPSASVNAFASYILRIKGIREGTEQVMVVLTSTNPLALTVVDLRRRLETQIPSLRTARWLIYLDPESDPFFEASAIRLGHLTGPLDEAPVWLGPQDSPFLVLSTRLRNRRFVCQGLEELDESILMRFGERLLVPFRTNR